MAIPNYRVRRWEEFEGVETTERLEEYFRTRLRSNPRSRLSRIDIENPSVDDPNISNCHWYWKEEAKEGYIANNLFVLENQDEHGPYNFLDFTDTSSDTSGGGRQYKFVEFFDGVGGLGMFRDEDMLFLKKAIEMYDCYPWTKVGFLQRTPFCTGLVIPGYMMFIEKGFGIHGSKGTLARDLNKLLGASMLFREYLRRQEQRLNETYDEISSVFEGKPLPLK